MGSSRFGKHYFKLWLPIVSLLLFVSAAELIFRAFRLAPQEDPEFRFLVSDVGQHHDLEYPFIIEDPLVLWSPQPNYAGWWPPGDPHPTEIRISSAGFRDREYSVEKGDHVFRILCLGDSCTFGYGLSEPETYPALLEETLSQNAKSGDARYEVINGGVLGYSSAQCLSLYKHKARKYQPDVITLWVGPNDASLRFDYDDNRLLQLMESRASREVVRRADEWLASLHAYRGLRGLVRSFRERKDKRFELKQRVCPEDFKKNVLALNKMCADSGGRLVVAAFSRCKDRGVPPNDFGFGVPRNHLEESLPLYRQALEEVAREHAIPYLFIREMTEYADGPNSHLFIDVFHPNAAGHALVMRHLYAFLAEGGFLPADARSESFLNNAASRLSDAPADEGANPNGLERASNQQH